MLTIPLLLTIRLVEDTKKCSCKGIILHDTQRAREHSEEYDIENILIQTTTTIAISPISRTVAKALAESQEKSIRLMYTKVAHTRYEQHHH